VIELSEKSVHDNFTDYYISVLNSSLDDPDFLKSAKASNLTLNPTWKNPSTSPRTENPTSYDHNADYIRAENQTSDIPILKLQPHKKYLATMIKESDDIIPLLPDDGFLPDYKSFCWNDKTQKFRCLPGAYIAGMVKCGTTDLYAKLEWHQDILKPPAGKENMYWPRSRVGRKIGLTQAGHRSKEKFQSYTDRMTPGDMKGKKQAVILDGTPCLLAEHREWERRYSWAAYPPYTNADLIHFVSPQAKIIAMVRDPVERLWSDYLYFDRGEPRNNLTFNAHVQEEITRFQSCLHTRDLRYCCYSSQNSLTLQLSLGIYLCFLQDWKENFGDNLLVITLEEYSEHTEETLKRVFGFLEIEMELTELRRVLEEGKTENLRRDEDVLQGDMLDSTRVLLQSFYQPYNVLLARYFQDRKFLF
jgi:N-acetylgalactosamine 4-sulfate 6-O-sulfotransferase